MPTRELTNFKQRQAAQPPEKTSGVTLAMRLDPRVVASILNFYGEATQPLPPINRCIAAALRDVHEMIKQQEPSAVFDSYNDSRAYINDYQRRRVGLPAQCLKPGDIPLSKEVMKIVQVPSDLIEAPTMEPSDAEAFELNQMLEGFLQAAAEEQTEQTEKSPATNVEATTAKGFENESN